MKMEKLFARYESIVPDYELFMQYLKKPLVPSLRLNTLKAKPEQILALLDNVRLRELPVYPHAFIAEGRYSLGNHIAHNLGLIYVQEIASMIPVVVLDPQPGEIVLDLCAAPGSKTTQIAQAMANQGLLVVNEVNRRRMRGLIHNIKRCGLMNEVVVSIKGQKLYRIFTNYFDRVLVDAPCSAEGTVRRSHAVLYHWGIRNIQRMSRIQIGLVVSGFRALRPGGTMVYSTCTVAPEENEMVISYLLEKFPDAEIQPVRLPGLEVRPGITRWLDSTFDPRLEKCIRILPQDNDTAPFFVAKIIKRGVDKGQDGFGKVESDSSLIRVFADRFGVDAVRFRPYVVFKHGDDNFISTPETFSFRRTNTIRRGLEFGRLYDREFKPDNDMVQIFGKNAMRNVVDVEEGQMERFLRGEVVPADDAQVAEKGFVIVRFRGLPLGVGRNNGTEIKSAIKRERRTP